MKINTKLYICSNDDTKNVSFAGSQISLDYTSTNNCSLSGMFGPWDFMGFCKKNFFFFYTSLVAANAYLEKLKIF